MEDLRDEEVKAVVPEEDTQEETKPEEAKKEAEAGEAGSEETQTKDSSDESSDAQNSSESGAENDVADDTDEDLEPVDLDSDRKSSRNKSSRREAAERKKRVRKTRKGKEESASKEKTGMDPYKKKRIMKRLRVLLILLILVGLLLVGYFKWWVPRQAEKQAMANQSSMQTDTIERRDVVDCITTTGTVQSNKSVDLTVTTPSDGVLSTTVQSVNVSVGDMVKQGDVLFVFSTYTTLDENIAYAQASLSEQRQKDSIKAQSNERSYYYTYTNQAVTLENAAASVESALKNLYDACDGYGNAKRELQKAIDEGASDTVIESKKSAVNSAYNTEQQAQENYEKAVQSQAQTVASTGNTLTEADENLQLNKLQNDDSARDYNHQIENLEKQKAASVVYAPFDGLITAVNLVEGNLANASSVCTIQDVSKMQISAQIDEYDVAKISLGQYVAVRSDPLGDAEMDGVVTFIAPTSTVTKSSSSTETANASSTTSNPTYEIKVDIVNPDERLKLGMSTKLSIVTSEVNGVLTVPYDAISEDAQGNSYITVIDNSAGAGANSGTSGQPVLQVNGQNVAQGGSQSGSGSNSGLRPSGGPGGSGSGGPGGGPGGMAGGFGGGFGSSSSKAPSGNMPTVNTRDIYVEVGLEGDYYTQISSDEISAGMTVVIPQSESSSSFGMGMMPMGGGGMP